MPKKEEFDVKEEPESPGLGEGATAQASQPSVLPQERSCDAEASVPYQDTRSGPRQAPWIYVRNELRSVQLACEQLRTQADSVLRTQVDSVVIGVDVSEILDNQNELP